VGHFWFAPEGIGKKLLRVVHLRSYSFYLAFFDDTTPRKEDDFFSEVFTSLNSETKLEISKTYHLENWLSALGQLRAQ